MENGKSRLRQAQEDVEDVKVIMMDNLNKAEERSGKLEDLEDRAEQMLETSKVFEKTAKKVKQQKRWENRKMKVVVGGILVATVVVIVVLASLLSWYNSDSKDDHAPVATTATNRN